MAFVSRRSVSHAGLPAGFTGTGQIEIGPDQRRTAQRGEDSLLRRFIGGVRSRHGSLGEPLPMIPQRSLLRDVDHGELMPPNSPGSIAGFSFSRELSLLP